MVQIFQDKKGCLTVYSTVVLSTYGREVKLNEQNSSALDSTTRAKHILKKKKSEAKNIWPNGSIILTLK